MGAYMAAAEGMFTGILILAVIILSVNMVLCLVRAVLGPRFSDRLIAINMIGTKTVLIIALLIKVFHEDYLVDICLIYALISFLSFVVLTKLLDQRMNRGKGNAGEKHAGREHAGKGAKSRYVWLQAEFSLYWECLCCVWRPLAYSGLNMH